MKCALCGNRWTMRVLCSYCRDVVDHVEFSDVTLGPIYPQGDHIMRGGQRVPVSVTYFGEVKAPGQQPVDVFRIVDAALQPGDIVGADVKPPHAAIIAEGQP